MKILKQELFTNKRSLQFTNVGGEIIQRKKRSNEKSPTQGYATLDMAKILQTLWPVIEVAHTGIIMSAIDIGLTYVEQRGHFTKGFLQSLTSFVHKRPTKR